MNWINPCRLLAIMCLAAAHGSARAAEPEESKTSLHWRTGESLHGEIVEATPEQLSWRSAVFQEPILLNWDVVGRIDSVRKSTEPGAPFSFAMRDGSFLYGDIAEITPEHLATIERILSVFPDSEVVAVSQLRTPTSAAPTS